MWMKMAKVTSTMVIGPIQISMVAEIRQPWEVLPQIRASNGINWMARRVQNFYSKVMRLMVWPLIRLNVRKWLWVLPNAEPFPDLNEKTKLMKRFLVLCISTLVLFTSCEKEVIWVPDGYGASEVKKPEGEYVSDQSFKRVAYAYHNNAIANFDTTKLDYVTHLHFAFLNPHADANGNFAALTNQNNFEALNKLARSKGVKTAISLSGSENIFRTIAANENTRKVFVKNIVDFAVRYQLDGVDIDWEYPRSNYGNDVTFEVFMNELSAELHSWHKYLSMAVTAGLFAGTVKEGITKGAIDACDFVNLMAYDGIGTDPNNLNHHSSYYMANRVLDIWLNDKQLPAEKAVLGIPLYGKSAANASATFASLISSGADPHADEFTNTSDVTFYYNGINTIQAKTELAKTK